MQVVAIKMEHPLSIKRSLTFEVLGRRARFMISWLDARVIPVCHCVEGGKRLAWHMTGSVAVIAAVIISRKLVLFNEY